MDREERKERGEVLVLVAEMVSPAPLETPDDQDLQDLPALPGLVETLLLRWLVASTRRLVVVAPRWV